MTISGSSSHRQRVVLDTCGYSHFRTGDERVLNLMSSSSVIYMPAIVLGELESAFRLGRRREENIARLGEFLEEPFVSVLNVTPDVAQCYGKIFSELKTKGSPIPINDVWIAAITQCAGAALVTFDGDFKRVPGLNVVVLSTK